MKEEQVETTELQKSESTAGTGLQVVDMSDGFDLPDLSEAAEIPIDLSVRYWTPEKEGESKRLFVDKVDTTESLNKETGEVSLLETAFFYEKVDGDVVSICNASKRLVAAIKDNRLQRGTPVKITYLGKVRNKTNSFSSDNWKIVPLKVNL